MKSVPDVAERAAQGEPACLFFQQGNSSCGRPPVAWDEDPIGVGRGEIDFFGNLVRGLFGLVGKF